MNKDDLATKHDLWRVKEDIIGFFLSKMHPQKEFYSPKEFESKTGIPYSTVVHRCNTGKLKAFQESPNCSWLIYASELERYRNQAEENLDPT